jgi:6-phosphogluconate dehydrogenase
MRIGMIGLGRMGANMVRRLCDGGVEVVGYNRDLSVAERLATECDMTAVGSIEQLIAALARPRTVWLMLPAGPVTESHIEKLAGMLERGDLLVDGANSNFNDSMRRNHELAERGIELIDAGVSGGIWGRSEGYALMLGGTAAAIERLRPTVEALSPGPDRGWLHCGPSGSGHYVKMIHNGIEYGLMQAYAEGLALMQARKEFGLDLAKIAETWRHGSVVRSWLLDLTAAFLAEDQELEAVAPFVADSGEGRWTAIEAIEQGIPAPIMSTAVMMRLASQGRNDYAAKLLAMMRKSFGGHALERSGDE